ncbi:MAG: hypothetical protein KF836_10765 [Fimbriimonadaceae bacterium]|nr:hypothetical protein [Fimbriimonadaceae bacterium]
MATITVAYIVGGVSQLASFYLIEFLSGGKVGGGIFAGSNPPGPLFLPVQYITTAIGGIVSGLFGYAVFKSTKVIKIMLIVWLILGLLSVAMRWRYYLDNRIFTPLLFIAINLVGTAIGGRLIHLTPPKESQPKS